MPAHHAPGAASFRTVGAPPPTCPDLSMLAQVESGPVARVGVARGPARTDGPAQQPCLPDAQARAGGEENCEWSHCLTNPRRHLGKEDIRVDFEVANIVSSGERTSSRRSVRCSWYVDLPTCWLDRVTQCHAPAVHSLVNASGSMRFVDRYCGGCRSIGRSNTSRSSLTACGRPCPWRETS